MSRPVPRPPRLAGRLLGWAAERLRTPELATDADALFRERAERDGAGPARRWYRRQAGRALFAVLRGEGRRPRGGAVTGAGRVVPGRFAAFSLLDFKLGVRMLLRHPGLTAVGGVAMAFGIAVGAGTFEFLKDAMYPRLPFAGGERIVRLQAVDAARGERIAVPAADFEVWRAALRTVEDVGAMRTLTRALDVGGGVVVPATGAEVTAGAFEMVGAAPLLGRALGPADAEPGAAGVAVLGHDFWTTHFGSSPDAVGREVRSGDAVFTVVGVMPRDHAFPVRADFYVPLRLGELAARSRAGDRGAEVVGFGRVAAGVTLEEAAAEAATLPMGSGAATGTGEPPLRPSVEPFAYGVVDTGGIAANKVFAAMAVLLVALMVVMCANVALLLFARAATRRDEMAVRSALGASRARIVGQLSVEALVLAGVATVTGLAAAAALLRWGMGLVNAGADGALPFWIGDTLSPPTVAWAAMLALVGAAVAGVLPGLQVTRRRGGSGLPRSGGRGAGPALRGVWTAVVVVQVALTVVFMPVVIVIGTTVRELGSAETPAPVRELLVARLEPAGTEDLAAAARALRARLEQEPWVRSVSLTSTFWPAWYNGRSLEAEGVPPAEDPALRRSQQLDVEPDYFRAVDARLVAGRLLTAEDGGAERRPVVVSEGFVERVLGGRNAVGRRLRLTRAGAEPGDPDAEGTWHEIVGVVEEQRLNPHMSESRQGVVYWPLPPDAATARAVLVRVTGSPAEHRSRLQVLALEAVEGLRVDQPVGLDARRDHSLAEYGAWFRIVAAAGGVTLLLTLAGVYAVTAYTVARRTREIGVRVAMGARPHQVARAVFSTAVGQVGMGVLVGGMIIPLGIFALARLVEPNPTLPPPLVFGSVLLGYLAIMMSVSLLACAVPLRRALGVQPVEALGAEG